MPDPEILYGKSGKPFHLKDKNDDFSDIDELMDEDPDNHNDSE